MKPNKLLITISILTLVILGLGVWLLARPAPGSRLGASVASPGRAEVPVTEFDWGTIDYGAGDAVAEFTINNPGPGTLSLAEVGTSCMCTTAQIIINDQKSPYFGMHAKSSWVGQVPAGGQAKLKVVFDPAFHGPQGVGPFTRQIVMKTNDPEHPKLEFNLTGTVIK